MLQHYSFIRYIFIIIMDIYIDCTFFQIDICNGYQYRRLGLLKILHTYTYIRTASVERQSVPDECEYRFASNIRNSINQCPLII